MSRDVLKTLYHPFESGDLPLPGPSGRVLFLGAVAGMAPPKDFASVLFPVQGFRPDYVALEHAGLSPSPRPQGNGFDAALVLAGRFRGRNEGWVAEAVKRVKPGGLVVVAGNKLEGAASLRKRMAGIIAIEGYLSKHHGVVFWLHRPEAADGAIQALTPPSLMAEGRYVTAPGMFSSDRADSGSRFLAHHLPQDARGTAADFGAGWGYLSAELVRRNPSLHSIDLYEADYESLEAARRNLAEYSVPARFHWRDLVAEPVLGAYDTIVMNPPFHLGRSAEPELGRTMITRAAKALRPGGRLFMVANRGLPYDGPLAASFTKVEELASDTRYRVFAAQK